MFGSVPYRRQAAAPQAPVTVYGTRWCAQTMIIRRYLERQGIPYRYVDLEADPYALSQLSWWTGGRASHPVVSVGGQLLVEPGLRELDWVLSRHGLRW